MYPQLRVEALVNHSGNLHEVGCDPIVQKRNVQRGDCLLDDVYHKLMDFPDDRRVVHEALDNLFGSLRDYRSESGGDQWQEMVERSRSVVCYTRTRLQVGRTTSHEAMPATQS
jgi:hypothetical protein